LHSAAGWRIEPPVSVPVAAGASARPRPRPNRRTSRRERVVSQGFFTGPKKEVSFDEPMANSSMLVLPSDTAPARVEALDDRRVVGADEIASIFEPQVVASPRRRKCPSGRSGCRSAAGLAGGDAGIGGARLSQAFSAVDGDEGVELRVQAAMRSRKSGSARRWKSALRPAPATVPAGCALIIRSPSARDRGRLRFPARPPGSVAAVGLGDAVFAQALADILGVRHRLDALRIDGLHLLRSG
jgi:hypothetical protein